MAWIEVHQALRDHRKILDLSEALDLPEPYVVGSLIYLWLWAVDNAPDGVLPKSRRIIEKAAAWQGQQGRFVDALITCALLDDDNGVLSIHDWDEYVGKLIEQRADNAARQAALRARRKAEKEAVTKSNSDVTVTRNKKVTGRNRLPYLTQPNRTQQNHTEPLSLARTPAHEGLDADASEREDDATQDETTKDDKQRKTQIRAVIVEQWGQPDTPDRPKWNAGIQQIADTRYTLDEIRLAFAAYPQRRPKSACNPVAFAREIGALLIEARASPSIASPQKSSKPADPTPAEMEAMNAQILAALNAYQPE